MYTHEEAIEAYLEAGQSSRYLAPKTNQQPIEAEAFWGRTFASIEEMDAKGVNL